MTALLTLQDISYSAADGRNLFQSINVSIGTSRIGLIGRNGVGKSTLLRLMSGALAPKAGTISRHGTIGMMRQVVQTADDETLADLFGVSVALARLDRITSGVGCGDDIAEDIASADWMLPQRMSDTLVQVGLGDMQPERLLGSLSGGQQTRAALAVLVFHQPDLILLDEPTNNLDHDGRAAVIDMLSRWRGGAVVVSHDRNVLRAMDGIAELTGIGMSFYGGNWDFYEAKKKEELETAARNLTVASAQANEVERKARETAEKQARRDARGRKSRFSAGQSKMLLDAREDRAQQSKGRGDLRAERQRGEAGQMLQDAEAKLERLKAFSFDIVPVGVPAGKVLLALNDVTGGPRPDMPVIRNLSLTITGPERVALSGPNGAGKTSLLRLIIGDLVPVEGNIRRNADMVMLDQQVGLLRRDTTIFDNYRRINPDSNDNEARAALARFMFRGDAALRQVSDLSGGELLRAALACVLGGTRPPELLILDEPTNHLDLASIEAVEAALTAYDGALLVVSHDLDFLQAIGVGRRISL